MRSHASRARNGPEPSVRIEIVEAEPQHAPANRQGLWSLANQLMANVKEVQLGRSLTGHLCKAMVSVVTA